MVNFPISLGIIDKNLILPIIYIIANSLNNIYDSDCEINYVSIYLDYFGNSIGELMIFFVSATIKYKGNIKQIKKRNIFTFIKEFCLIFLLEFFSTIKFVYYFFM